MEKVQSETGVGAMTPEQILELAHEAGFPRDTIFYRSDQFITFARAVAQRTREELLREMEDASPLIADAIRSMTK